MKKKNGKFGEFLKQSRIEQGMTLRSAEEITGVSNAYISQLESGRISDPSPVILDKLAKCYDVSYTQLMSLCGYRVPDMSDEMKRILAENSRLHGMINSTIKRLRGEEA